MTVKEVAAYYIQEAGLPYHQNLKGRHRYIHKEKNIQGDSCLKKQQKNRPS